MAQAARGVSLAVLLAVACAAGAATSIGQKPLSDRGSGEYYLDPVAGEPGLFPGGANVPSGAHLLYGQGRLAAIVPRDAAGLPSPDGWIGFASVGMSNTNQEWSRFERLADGAGEHADRVVLIDAAQGGVDASRMAQASDVYWSLFDSRLVSAGLTPGQVQVVWLKQHLPPVPTYPQPTFTAAVDQLEGYLEAIVGILRARLPNLQVVYFSSRIYAGHGSTPGPTAPEPFGFESAFAVKGAIRDQLNGVGDLATGPWLTWGPYLWADGITPRSDGLTWQSSDIEPDATHPTLAGEIKVANLLRGFFAGVPWYPSTGGGFLVARNAAADAFVDTVNPTATHGADLVLDLTTTRPVHVRFDLSGLPSSPLARAKLSLLADADLGLGGGSVYLAAGTTWDEATIDATNAPAATGPALASWSGWSRGAALGVEVTAAVAAALASHQSAIGFVLTSGVAGNSRGVAREAGDAPRLVLTFETVVFRDSFEGGGVGAWSGAGP